MASNAQNRSRYTGRYDSDRRSRSPPPIRDRDRSPERYNDRGSQYGDDRRRLSGENRSNQPPFQSNRDGFRDNNSRDPPRGPKALNDLPGAPRGGGFAGDFRGRGRGGGQGRGWMREDSRDNKGPRDRDDFRDRRDPPFRDDRSRERERDWRDRDFRQRWQSPPTMGRGIRSPPGRGEPQGREPPLREPLLRGDSIRGEPSGRPDGGNRDPRDMHTPLRDPRDILNTRDIRELPLGGLPDAADRPRRGSRDGPLSAGSASSDPAFNSQQSYRGSTPGRGRPSQGRGRPQGDWEPRGRGGRAGSIYDDRDRFPRSRSQEGRWPRNDRDDRDGYRYVPDNDQRGRDARDERDGRDLRDREVPWPKQDRSSLPRDTVSRETLSRDPAPPPASPPPVAPSAPAFGSIPARPPSVVDSQASSGKAAAGPSVSKPTTDDKAASSTSNASPATGTSSAVPAKPPPTTSSSGGIPTGPRLQQPLPPKPQRASSVQWVNPGSQASGTAKPASAVSPGLGRSHSALLPSSSSAVLEKSAQRPRSDDAKAAPSADIVMADANQQSEPGEIADNVPSSSKPATEKPAAKPARSPVPTTSGAERVSDTKKPTGIFARNAALKDAAAAKFSRAKSPAAATTKQDKERPKESDKEAPKEKKPVAKDDGSRETQQRSQAKLQNAPEAKPNDVSKTAKATTPVEKSKDKAEGPGKSSEPTAKPTTQPTDSNKDAGRDAAKEGAIVHGKSEKPEKPERREKQEREKEFVLQGKAASSSSAAASSSAAKKESAKVLDQNPPVNVAALMVSVRRDTPASTAPDRTSDSDEEDMNDFFDLEITKHETELKKLQDQAEAIPKEGVARAALLETFLARDLLEANFSLVDAIGPVPDDVLAAWKKADEDAAIVKKEPSVVPLSSAAPAAGASDSTVGPPPRTPTIGSDPAADKMEVDSAPVTSTPTVAKTSSSPIPARKKPSDATATTGTTAIPIPVVPQPQSRPSSSKSNKANGLSGNVSAQAKSSAGSPPGLEQTRGSRPSTPSQPEEDEDATDIDDVIDYSYPDVARFYMKTPPPEDLPNYSLSPWYDDRSFLKEEEPSSGLASFIVGHMRDVELAKTQQQQRQRNEYRDNYVKYLQFTESDDIVAVKSRDKYMGIHGMAEIPAPATPPVEQPRPEGRGTGRRFATERDLERVLQASMREEDERKERELRAQNERHPSIKEATIPGMYWTDEERVKELFIDHSGFLPPEKMVTSWQVLPPIINFTVEEAAQFEKAYMEFPKQWGRIAEAIPTRDFHACIQYYYTVKKELNLKEKLKRQPKRRKKGTRGKQRSSALVSELGNPDENEDTTNEVGENGERRRPRRAAAPTWGFETATAAADSDGATPASTPGGRRRGGTDSGVEKPDGRRNRRRAPKDKEKDKDGKDKEAKDGKDAKEPKDAKDATDAKEAKEPKQPKTPQIIAPPGPGGSAATASGKSGRSRSNSRVQGSPRPPSDHSQQSGLQQSPMPPKLGQPHRKDGQPATITPIPVPAAPPAPKMSPYYDGPSSTTPHGGMHPPLGAAQALASSFLDAKGFSDASGGRLGYGTIVDKAIPPATSLADMLAPPSLRPEQPPPPLPIGITNFDVNVTNPERLRSVQQTSSYWSVSECNDFPALLRAFGTDWYAIAQHMQTKTPVMVKNYYVRQKNEKKAEWEAIANEANQRKSRGEKLPSPPPPPIMPRKRLDAMQQATGAAASAGAQRAHAAASKGGEPMEDMKSEGQSQFSRYQTPVPIAQAPPPAPPLPPQAKSSSAASAGAAAAQPPAQVQPQAVQPTPPSNGKRQSQQAQQQPPQIAVAPVSAVPLPQQGQVARSPVPYQQHMPQHIQQHAHAQSPSARPMRGPPSAIPPPPYGAAYHDRDVVDQQMGGVGAGSPQPPPSSLQQQQQQVSSASGSSSRKQPPPPPPSSSAVAAVPAPEPMVQPRPTTSWADSTNDAVDARLNSIVQRNRQREMQQQQQQQQQQQMLQQQQPPHLRPDEQPGRMMKQEPEPSRYDPYAASVGGRAPPPRQPEPIRVAHTPPQPYGQPPPPIIQHQPVRSLLTEPVHPQVMGVSEPRPMSSMARPMHGGMHDSYAVGAPPPPASTPTPAPRAKTSSLMALLNDDPPAPKRVSDVSSSVPQSSTPPPPAMGGRAPPPPAHHDAASPYSPYGRNPPPPQSQSAIPPLKPYPAPAQNSPQVHSMAGPGARSSVMSPVESAAAADRDYYSRHPYQSQQQQPPPPPSQSYPPQQQPGGYGSGYGSQGPPQQVPHAPSPTPQYPGHPPPGRRDPIPQGRDNGGWSQPPPPHHYGGAGGPSQGPPPTSAWGGPGSQQQQQSQQQPPSHHHHLSGGNLRDDRAYAPPPQQQQQQPPPQHAHSHSHSHSLSGRYHPSPVPRSVEPTPPPQQQPPPYGRYSSGPPPGPGGPPPPRDPRDGRYTPVGYDSRGPPPPANDNQGPPPPGPYDPRDPRDPRNRQMRPQDEYGRYH